MEGTREMNNEPVAYIDPYDLERLPHYDCYIGSQQLKNGIPLYTHQIKDLTEDDIKKCADSVCHAWKKNGVGELYMEDFARAILRKASEK